MQMALEQVEEEQAEHIGDNLEEVSALAQIQRDFPTSQSPIFDDDKKVLTQPNDGKENMHGDHQQNFSFSEENPFDDNTNAVSLDHHLNMDRMNIGERPDQHMRGGGMQRGG